MDYLRKSCRDETVLNLLEKLFREFERVRFMRLEAGKNHWQTHRQDRQRDWF